MQWARACATRSALFMVESAEQNGPRERGLWQWFWRSAELARARQELRDVPAQQRTSLRRAQAALELADRAAHPIDPLSRGSSLPLSLTLYREAAYWALVAQDASVPPTHDLTSAWAHVPEEVRTRAAGGHAGLVAVESALVSKTHVETAEDSPEQQRTEAQAAHAFVEGLVNEQLGAERRVGRALVERSVRLSAFAILLVALSVGIAVLYSALTTGPNLAAGKPWRASSAYPGIPKGTNGEYLFHTQDEDNPWYEVDLGKPTQISVVQVKNRVDCCPERAAPAIIEVSSDQTHWKEVSRRKDSYSLWTAKFAPVTARYVRVRVPRRTILHLADVTVRAH